MEFLNDYNFQLHYQLGKANMVIDALSQKSLHATMMMVKEMELMKSFRDFELGSGS